MSSLAEPQLLRQRILEALSDGLYRGPSCVSVKHDYDWNAVRDAMKAMTEQGLLEEHWRGGLFRSVAAYRQYPHITQEWDADSNPVCIPNCPRCKGTKVELR